MKFSLTSLQWIGLSLSLLCVDGLILYAYIFHPSLYQAEAATTDYRINELRRLESGLVLEPISPAQALNGEDQP